LPEYTITVPQDIELLEIPNSQVTPTQEAGNEVTIKDSISASATVMPTPFSEQKISKANRIMMLQ